MVKSKILKLFFPTVLATTVPLVVTSCNEVYDFHIYGPKNYKSYEGAEDTIQLIGYFNDTVVTQEIVWQIKSIRGDDVSGNISISSSGVISWDNTIVQGICRIDVVGILKNMITDFQIQLEIDSTTSIYTYEIDNNKCWITGLNAEGSELSYLYIPSKIDNYDVIGIGTEAFIDENLIKHVSFSNTIQYINQNAFKGCDLQELTIPSSVIEIGSSAFSSNFNLKKVVFEDGIQLSKINGNAFAYCQSLETFSVPESLVSIGEFCFSNCSSLQNFTINKNLQTIEKGAFYNCDKLDNIVASPDNTYIGWASNIDGNAKVLVYKNTANNDFSLAKDCSNVAGSYAQGDIQLPDTIESVSENAFWYCSGIRNFSLNLYVKNLGKNAFKGCSNIISFDFKDSTSIGDYCFFECISLSKFILSDKLSSIGVFAFGKCVSIPFIEFPTSLLSIGKFAFYECGNLTNIDFSKCVNLSTIGTSSFYECIIQEIHFSSENSTYGIATNVSGNSTVIVSKNEDEEFKLNSNCTNVVGCLATGTIALFEDITSIYSNAFQGCSSIKGFNFVRATNITEIGDNAFAFCNSLVQMNFIPCTSLVMTGASFLANCKNLQVVKTSPTTTKIGSASFMACPKLRNVTLSYISNAESEIQYIPYQPNIILGSNNFENFYVDSTMIAKYINDSHWSTLSKYFKVL